MSTHDLGFKYFETLPYAVCSCGWEGPTRDTAVRAADDGRAHRRAPDEVDEGQVT